MDSANTELRGLLPQLTADAARELAREQDEQGDILKRRAKALFAYAAALDDDPDDPVEPTTSTRPVAGDSRKPGDDGRDLVDTRHAPPSDKKPLIRDLIGERPVPGWNPERVHRDLVERGLIPPETTKASIGVTMRRMFSKYGELAKTLDGLYTTPEHGELHREEEPQATPFVGSGPLHIEGRTSLAADPRAAVN